MTETEAEVEWIPPFCAHDTDLKCPKCGEESVYAREQQTYLDGNDVEAYCGECHARLTVYADVEIKFISPECAHSDCGLPGAECGCPAPVESEGGA